MVVSRDVLQDNDASGCPSFADYVGPLKDGLNVYFAHSANKSFQDDGSQMRSRVPSWGL